MEETDSLYPGKIKSMCENAISDLNDDNESLDKAVGAIEQFVSDDNLNTLAYRTLKDQMEAYYDVITLLKTANDYDIEDYNTLSSSVGDLDLVGSEIIPAMNQAKANEEYYLEKLDYANEMMNKYDDDFLNIFCLGTFDYYFYQSKYYDYMAGMAHEMYEIFEKLANDFDSINMETSILFSESSELRSSALDALDFLGANYSSGHYGSLSGVKNYWLDPYYDQIELDERLKELSEKLNVSAEEYANMSDIDKVEYNNNAIEYIMLYTSGMNLLPGEEVTVPISYNIVVTYKVEASVNGVSCNGNLGRNNSGNTVANLNVGDISIESEVDMQRKKLEETKIGINVTDDEGFNVVLNSDGFGVGTSKTIGNDTYEGYVVTNLLSETSTVKITSQIDIEDNENMQLESEVDVKYLNSDSNLDKEIAFEYVPVEEPEREYDMEEDLAWMTLGGLGVTGVATLGGLAVYYGGAAVVSAGATGLPVLSELMKLAQNVAGN